MLRRDSGSSKMARTDSVIVVSDIGGCFEVSAAIALGLDVHYGDIADGDKAGIYA